MYAPLCKHKEGLVTRTKPSLGIGHLSVAYVSDFLINSVNTFCLPDIF
jgi:hypothetical protein